MSPQHQWCMDGYQRGPSGQPPGPMVTLFHPPRTPPISTDERTQAHDVSQAHPTLPRLPLEGSLNCSVAPPQGCRSQEICSWWFTRLHNSRMPPQLEKNHVVPTAWQDEALLYYTTPSGVPRGPSQLHTSSKATLWGKAQHEGALPPPCIVRKDPRVPHTARRGA